MRTRSSRVPLSLIVLGIVPFLLRAGEARAEESPSGLFVTGANEEIIPMPLTRTEVSASISAFVARVEVVQIYENPFESPIEARYLFPLPEQAAVDDYQIEVGDRVIRGEIKRRDEAQAVYEEARLAGHTAAVLHQQRPNIFTQSVANIAPGENVRIILHYVERLVYEGGEYRFLFPMVVGPRYMPASLGGKTPDDDSLAYASSGGDPWPPDIEPMKEIDPPVLRPGTRTGHDISLSVTLDAGVPIREVTSESHAIDVKRTGVAQARVSLAESDTIPNKDFMLKWNVAGEEPEVAVLAHRDDDDGYFTLIVQPRADVAAEDAAPKEIIFVLDESGSMGGTPIEMSQRFMRLALRSLAPRDRFNIVRFAGSASVLASEPLDNTERNVSRGLRAVNEMAGSGGTEMLAGFRAALSQPQRPGYVRIVVFLTDGYIGNEDQILGHLRKARGEARIFALGIGTSVNHYLLREMARQGKGAYQYIRPDGREAEAVERFCGWVTRPYLTDLEVDWGTLRVEDVEPAELPDLYAGQNLSVVGRYLWGGRESIVVKGRLAGVPWEKTVDVALPEQAADHAVLASAWARERIRSLLEQDRGDDLVAQATYLGLAYRIMTPYTSFVAVDESRVVGTGAPDLIEQAVPMPEMTSFRGVFGDHGPTSRAEIHEAGLERIVVQAVGNIVDAESTYTSRRRRGKAWTQQQLEALPIIGHNYQDILKLNGGVTDPASGTFSQNVNAQEIEVTTAGSSAGYGRADGGFASILSRKAPSFEPAEMIEPLPEIELLDMIEPFSPRVEEHCLRVLADLADDGRLSRSEGLPALAALLEAQRADGGFSREPRIQRLAAWALQEAATAHPDLPWVRDAERRAADRLLTMQYEAERPLQCMLPDVTPIPGADACVGGWASALAPSTDAHARLVERALSGLAVHRLCGDGSAGFEASTRWRESSQVKEASSTP